MGSKVKRAMKSRAVWLRGLNFDKRGFERICFRKMARIEVGVAEREHDNIRKSLLLLDSNV